METDKKSNGAFIGSIIVVLILVLGGVYLWTSNSLKDKETVVRTEEQRKQKTLGELNAASAIEAELDGFDQANGNMDTNFDADVKAVQ